MFNCGIGIDDAVSRCALGANQQKVADHFREYLIPRYLIRNKIKNALLAVRVVILCDDTIKPDTVIDTINGTTKQDLADKADYYEDEFLAGVCQYTVAYVPNRDGKACIKEINAAYIDGFDIESVSITISKRTSDFSAEFSSETWIDLPIGVDGNELLEEVGNRCPVRGCNIPLRPMKKGRIHHYYRFLPLPNKGSRADISPLQGFIALCQTHHDEYKRGGATTDDWGYLRHTKEICRSRREASNRLFNSEFDLYKEAKQLLNNFDTRKRREKPKPDYGIVNIASKISDTDSAFFEEVQQFVAVNYKLLNSVVADYGREYVSFDPNAMWEEIHHAYLQIKGGAFTQEDIFHHLSKWLVEQTDSGISICEIMIAYFIQQCAVFDKPGAPSVDEVVGTGGVS